MLVYIRHGDDKVEDAEHRHDRHLSEDGRRAARKVAKRLIEKHGHPRAVYVSPYQRTLETLAAMSERFERPVSVHHDVQIAQHLSEKQRRSPDVDPATARVVVIDESRAKFHERIREHVAAMRRSKYDTSGEVIWCITHTVVIRRVAEHFDADVPKEIDFLDYVVVRR